MEHSGTEHHSSPPRVVVLTLPDGSTAANAHLDEIERMGAQCIRVASANEAAAEILSARPRRCS